MRFLFKRYVIILLLISSTSLIAVAQPVNDECSGAIILTDLKNWCSATGAYNNINATTSTNSISSCWSANYRDVWFSFTAVATDVTITITGNGTSPLVEPEVRIYQNNCPALGGSFICVPPTSGSNTMSYYQGNLTIGVNYLIRVAGNGSNQGTFQLCINNATPPPAPGQDCATATYLCNKNTFTVPMSAGSGAVKDVTNSCASSEVNSSWYTWQASNNGNLGFELNPADPTTDLDFVVYELPGGNCAAKTALRCVTTGSINAASPCYGATGLDFNSTDLNEPFSGCPAGTNQHAKYLTLQSGKIYALVVNNFLLKSGFTITFSGNGEFTEPKAKFTRSDTVLCLANNSFTFTNSSTVSTMAAVSYEWDFGADATPATSTTAGPHVVHYSTTGIKNIKLKVKNGNCEDEIIQKITVIDKPVADFTTTPTTNCLANNPYRIDIADQSSNGTNYNWDFGTDANPSTGTGSGPFSISYTNSGDKTIRLTVSNGKCDSIITKTVTINPCTPGLPTITVTTTNDTICKNQCTTIQAMTANGTAPLTVNWNQGLPAGEGPHNICPSQTIWYVATVTDNNGNTAKDSVLIVVHPLPMIDFSAENVCVGQATSFTNNSSALLYSWNFGDSQTDATINPQHTYLATGTYTVKLKGTSDKGCIDSLQKNTSVTPQPSAGFIADVWSGCQPLKVAFTDTATNTTDVTYAWDFGDGTSSTLQNPVHLYSTAGTYTVSVNTSSGSQCSRTYTAPDTVKVSPTPIPAFSATPEVVSLFDPLITFTNQSLNAVDWIWDLGDGTTDTLLHPIHLYESAGVYTVKLVTYNTGGCADSITKEIKVEDVYTLYVPSSFTPNGDGINDVFNPKAYKRATTEFKMYIYNRWGEEFFFTNDINKGWNGTFQNNIVQEDVYVWLITMTGPDENYQKTGHVTLIR